jgi:hypothetical protein
MRADEARISFCIDGIFDVLELLNGASSIHWMLTPMQQSTA